MALFGSKKLRKLEAENTRLKLAFNQIEDEIGHLKHQRFIRAIELEKEIIDKLKLSDSQVTELKFIFMIERAKALGVPEDKLLLTDEDIENFFMPKES